MHPKNQRFHLFHYPKQDFSLSFQLNIGQLQLNFTGSTDVNKLYFQLNGVLMSQ